MVFLCLHFGHQRGILIQKFLKHDCMRLDNSWEIQDGVFCEGNFGKNNALYIMVSITNAHGARPTKKCSAFLELVGPQIL